VPSLTVALVPAPDQVVVRLTGDADLSTAPVLTDALAQAATLGTRHLVVDIATARFWDSSGLRALTTVTAELAAAGRSCRIVGAGPTTRRLIAAAGLTDRLELDGPVGPRVAPPSAVPARTSRVAGRPRPGARPATRTPVPAGHRRH